MLDRTKGVINCLRYESMLVCRIRVAIPRKATTFDETSAFEPFEAFGCLRPIEQAM